MRILLWAIIAVPDFEAAKIAYRCKLWLKTGEYFI